MAQFRSTESGERTQVGRLAPTSTGLGDATANRIDGRYGAAFTAIHPYLWCDLDTPRVSKLEAWGRWYQFTVNKWKRMKS